MSFTLPSDFPLVGLGVAGIALLNLFQFARVGMARNESGVKYPNLYATDAEAKEDPKKYRFNCVQRSHANSLEMVPTILSTGLYVALFNPKVATGLILSWVFGRVFYTLQYGTGKPASRNNGLASMQYIGTLGLIGYSAYLAATQAYAILA